MFCEKCNKQIPDNSVFCAHCGEKIEVSAAPPSPQVQPAYAPPAYMSPPQVQPAYTSSAYTPSPVSYPQPGYAPPSTGYAPPGYAQAAHGAAPAAEKLSGGARVGMFALGFFLLPIGVLVAWLVKKGTSASRDAIKLSLIGFATSFALILIGFILATVIAANGGGVGSNGGGPASGSGVENDDAVASAELFADHGYRFVSCELNSCGDEGVLLFLSPVDDDVLLTINNKLLGTGTMAEPDSSAARVVINFEIDESFSGDVSFRLIREGTTHAGEATDVQFEQGANALAAVILTDAEVSGEYTVEALIDGKLIFSGSVSVTPVS